MSDATVDDSDGPDSTITVFRDSDASREGDSESDGERVSGSESVEEICENDVGTDELSDEVSDGTVCESGSEMGVQTERSRAFESASESVATGRVTGGYVVPMMVEEVGKDSSFGGSTTEKMCIGSIPGVDSRKKVHTSGTVFTELKNTFESGVKRDDGCVDLTRDNHVSDVSELTDQQGVSDVELSTVSESDVMSVVSPSIQYVSDDEDVLPVVYIPVHTVAYHGSEFVVAGEAALSEGAALQSLVSDVDDTSMEFTASSEELKLRTTRTTTGYPDFSVTETMSLVRTYSGSRKAIEAIRWMQSHSFPLVMSGAVLLAGLLTVVMIASEYVSPMAGSGLLFLLGGVSIAALVGSMRLRDMLISTRVKSLLTRSALGASIVSVSPSALQSGSGDRRVRSGIGR